MLSLRPQGFQIIDHLHSIMFKGIVLEHRDAHQYGDTDDNHAQYDKKKLLLSHSKLRLDKLEKFLHPTDSNQIPQSFPISCTTQATFLSSAHQQRFPSAAKRSKSSSGREQVYRWLN
jgi:hypothetical protein